MVLPCAYHSLQVDPSKPVVIVLTEGNPTSWGSVVGWANDEMKLLCDFQTKMYVDLSALAGDPGWVALDGPSETLLKVMKKTTLINVFLIDSSLDHS